MKQTLITPQSLSKLKKQGKGECKKQGCNRTFITFTSKHFRLWEIVWRVGSHNYSGVLKYFCLGCVVEY